MTQQHPRPLPPGLMRLCSRPLRLTQCPKRSRWGLSIRTSDTIEAKQDGIHRVLRAQATHRRHGSDSRRSAAERRAGLLELSGRLMEPLLLTRSLVSKPERTETSISPSGPKRSSPHWRRCASTVITWPQTGDLSHRVDLR